MASIELIKLFDTLSEDEAEAIATSALASRRYRLEMKAAVTSAILLPTFFSVLVLWLKPESTSMLVRLLLGLMCVGSIFFGLKLVYPINDKLVDRAIRRQLASRGRAGAP